MTDQNIGRVRIFSIFPCAKREDKTSLLMEVWRMIIMGKAFSVIIGIFLLSIITAESAEAKDYPEKPIQLLVGLAPGSSLELSARALAKVAPKYLGIPVVVVNMPGGAQTVAFNELVKAPPDGYTIGLMPTSYKSMTIHTQKVPFDPRILKVLLGYAQFESVLLVRADSPYGKFEDFIAYGRANPGSIKFGHSGRGIASHFIGVLLFKNANVKAVDVPFKGGTSEIVTAVLGGHVMAGVNTISGVEQHIKAGTLKALVTITDRRLKGLPDVPTLKELGYPDLSVFNTFLSVGIHRDTPVDRMKKLHDALKEAILDPELDKILKGMGMNSEYFSPETLEKGMLDVEKMAIPLLKEIKLFVE